MKLNRKNGFILLILAMCIALSACVFEIVPVGNVGNEVGQSQTTGDVLQGDHEDPLRVTFMDVGQADSILIQLPDQRNILIDGGNRDDGKSLVDRLKKKGVGKLDIVVATHPHEDHIGGLPEVLRNYEVERFMMPKRMAKTRIFEELLLTVQDAGLDIEGPVAGKWLIRDTDLGIRILAPDGDAYEDTNDSSIVLLLTYKDRSFLFTGDAEVVSERRILEAGYGLKADVLKVGHHGSKSSTSAHFLRQVNPTIAVISCGVDNDYGHPHDVTLKKLQKTRIYRTDSNGEIRIQTDGASLEVDTDK